jgi:hypothetical protein
VRYAENLLRPLFPCDCTSDYLQKTVADSEADIMQEDCQDLHDITSGRNMYRVFTNINPKLQFFNERLSRINLLSGP